MKPQPNHFIPVQEIVSQMYRLWQGLEAWGSTKDPALDLTRVQEIKWHLRLLEKAYKGWSHSSTQVRYSNSSLGRQIVFMKRAFMCRRPGRNQIK